MFLQSIVTDRLEHAFVTLISFIPGTRQGKSSAKKWRRSLCAKHTHFKKGLVRLSYTIIRYVLLPLLLLLILNALNC